MAAVSKWSRHYYYYHLGYTVISFISTITFLILFYSFGWWEYYKYSPPMVCGFWLGIFTVFSFFILALFTSYATYIEKYRDWLFFDYLGIRGDNKIILRKLIFENLEKTLHSLDQNIVWNDNIKLKFYLSLKTSGWILNDSQLILCYSQAYLGGSIALWPNYVKNAEKIKNEIYKSLKRTIDRFLLEQI